MTFATKMRAMLSLHEGRVPHAYKDSLGFWTIGVGHLIDERKGGKLPEHIIDALLDYDIEHHIADCIRLNPWVVSLDDVRKAALYDMFFNLGPEPFDDDGFKDWPIFERQMKTGDFSGAANNMRSTLWAKQVGQRAERLARMVETGQWPSEIT
jgi:lysozyme